MVLVILCLLLPHEAVSESLVDLRVWSVVEDRLIEVRTGSGGGEPGLRIEGLPPARTRTTADRLRAAIQNCGLVREAPSVLLRVEPPVGDGPTGELDLPLALGALARDGVVGAGLRSILATGRLGLDGSVYLRGASGQTSLGEVVEWLCRTPRVPYERMFEKDPR